MQSAIEDYNLTGWTIGNGGTSDHLNAAGNAFGTDRPGFIDTSCNCPHGMSDEDRCGECVEARERGLVCQHCDRIVQFSRTTEAGYPAFTHVATGRIDCP